MANPPWTCECGRKVPWSIGLCRCGKARPEPGATLAAGVDALKRMPAPQSSGADWSWLPKALGVLALVGLYFGSRMYNKYSTSREARNAAVEAIGQYVDKPTASAAVGKHHQECFEQYYQTGWGRRQSSKFDTEKYARCILEKSAGEIQRDASAARVAALRAEQEARATRRQQLAQTAAAAAPAPGPTPEERPNWGQATLGDVKASDFKREPQIAFQVDFVVLGSKLTPHAYCLVGVSCEQQQTLGAPAIKGCVLRIEGVKGIGSMHYVHTGPAPAGSACTLELQLSDGGPTRTNKVSVPLR